jgi:hypothetical protein
MDGVDRDKCFQEKQAGPEDVSKQTEEPPQPVDDCQAEEITRRKAEVVRSKVEEAIRGLTDIRIAGSCSGRTGASASSPRRYAHLMRP